MNSYIDWLMTRETALQLVFTFVPLMMFILFALIAFVLWEATNAFIRLELALLVFATLPYVYYKITTKGVSND